VVNAKEMMDKAILELDIGHKIVVKCSVREGNSLRVRLSRERLALSKDLKSLANSLWISMNKVIGEEDVVTVTLGRGGAIEDDIKIVTNTGEELPYHREQEEDNEVDIKRMKELMEKDGVDPELQKKLLGEVT